MPRVRIGNGAVVDSNSVVTKDVPAYAIAGGSPANVIRQRFSRSIAEALETTAWWDWTTTHSPSASRIFGTCGPFWHAMRLERDFHAVIDLQPSYLNALLLFIK